MTATTTRRRTWRGMSYDEIAELAKRDCTRCGRASRPEIGGNTPQSRDEILCYQCVNELNAQIDAQRKAELAARPDCEACGKRKQRYGIAGVWMCGPCAKRAQWNLRQPMLYATGWSGITRERIITAATTGPMPPKRRLV